MLSFVTHIKHPPWLMGIALAELLSQVGEESKVESMSYKVKVEDGEERLRHRGFLELDQLDGSTAYWAALTTITQVLSQPSTSTTADRYVGAFKNEIVIPML